MTTSALIPPSSQPARLGCTRAGVGPPTGVGYGGARGGFSRGGIPAPGTACDRGVHMGLGFPRGDASARDGGQAADFRGAHGAVRRPLPGRTGRRRSRPPRPGRPPGPVRAQGPQDPDDPHGARLHARRGPPVAVRRVRQRRGPRSRRPGLPADLGRQHPRLLRRRRHVLAGERPSGRTARLARHQPQPARVRRQRSARLARRVDRDAGQPDHGRPAARWRPARSWCSATPWAARSPSSSPTTTRGTPSG